MAAETDNVIRRSLAAAFDHRTSVGSAAVAAATTAAEQSHPDFPTIRRSLNLGSRPAVQRSDAAQVVGEQSMDVSRMPMRDFQRLVDAVVDAVEQRVIDELERRGRRNPGVF